MPHPLPFVDDSRADWRAVTWKTAFFVARVSVHLHFTNEIIYLVLRMNVNSDAGGCLWNERWWFTWFTAIWRVRQTFSIMQMFSIESFTNDSLALSPCRSSEPSRSLVGQWLNSRWADWANNGRSHWKSSDVAFRAEIRFEFNIHMPSHQYAACRTAREQLRSGSSP